MTAADIIRILELEPHPREGGFFKETYRSSRSLPRLETHPHPRLESTAIYYLLTPKTYSRLHRLRGDEVFHHYAGDAVEMLQLFADGSSKVLHIGKDLAAGERPQVLAPAHVWQGSKLVEGGAWALLGCTVAPGFEYEDYEDTTRAYFLEQYPQEAMRIVALTPD
jgi:uncharacterized protein